MKRTHVCAQPGCHHLVPCALHSRPANASWSPDRDKHAHWKLRMAVIKARGNRCERCAWQSPTPQGKGLQLHHHGPKDLPEHVTLLCTDCHRAVDSSAR